MPYKNNADLPTDVKGLPEHAKTIWRSAFDSAFKDGKDEKTCFQIAWAAVKEKYKKSGESWIEKMKAFVSLQGLAKLTLSSDEILAMIPSDKLSALKEKDAHPFFQAYSFCHEGTSRPISMSGENKPTPITWFREAIKTIKNKVLTGVKFFLGHNEDIYSPDKEVLGEVVASQEKEIDGVLHHIVVGYFPNKEKVADLDICSQEADWDLYRTPVGFVADTLYKVFGIALASSKIDSPGCPGALRLGAVQALHTIQAFESVKNSKRSVKAMGDLANVTLKDLISELENRNLYPHQVFSKEKLAGDFKIREMISEAEKPHKEALDVEKKKLESLTKELETEKVKSAAGSVKDRLDAVLKSQNATTEQAEFVKARFNKNAPQDITDKGLEDYAKTHIDLYLDAHGKPKSGSQSGGTDESASDNGSVDPKDFSKKANNEFLSEDLED